MVDDVGEHLPRRVQLGLAVAVRVVQAEVDESELLGLGVDVNASDRTDAFDDGFLVATPLAPYHSILCE